MKSINSFKINQTRDPGFRRFRVFFTSLLILSFLILIWFGKDIVRSPEPRTLVVYCFSGMQEVMEDAIFPAFQDYWLKNKGEKLEYIPTFAGSGKITDKILTRFPAEVAILSSKIDAWRLSKGGISSSQSLKDLPYQSILNRTPIVMLVREGNPKGIVHFADLENPGIEIVCPDPLTSGAGQLGILALYGSRLHKNEDELKFFRSLKGMWSNIIAQPSSARDALQQFISNKGDVLIIYESNILRNPKRNQIRGQLIYPQSTIFCEPIVLSIEKNIDSKQRELVDAFIQFLWSKETQQLFVDYGYHSVLDKIELNRFDFGQIQDPFTLNSLGSYREIKAIIDKLVNDQL